MLTPRGRNYVLKAMMLKGIAPVTYSLWARSNAFFGNQGVKFLSGKVLALSIMDKVWPRVGPMLDISKHESDECMSHLFESDGSYMESVGYLDYALRNSVPIYVAYSRFKKQPLAKVVPSCMENFGNYAEVIASTCKDSHQMFIPLGQCLRNNISFLTCAFLAAACPGSMWVNIYKKIPEKNKVSGFTDTLRCKGIRTMRLCTLADKSPVLKKPRNFVLLKKCGLISSLREFMGKKIKIVAVGDAADVRKKMFDCSSFILEFTGDSFAMQMPVMSGIFSESQFRNMTVPLLKNGLYANQKYLRHHKPQTARDSQCPAASGDAKSFKCKINANLSWDKKYFSEFSRTIDSPSPDEITITDEYQLGNKAVGAAFMLITGLPVKVTGNKALITGRYGGRAKLSVSDGCKITVEKFAPNAKILKGMNMQLETKLNRLIISKSGQSNSKDKIVINIKLAVCD